MDTPAARLPPQPHWPAHIRRAAAAALLLLAGGGAAITAKALALSEVRLWCAILLVQGLALAAVAGVALLSVPPPGLARRASPGA